MASADNTFETLLATLNDFYIEVRQGATFALGRIDDPRAINPLINTLNDTDEDVWVRSTAASALGVIGDRRALEPLVTALNDSNKDVRQWTAEALGRIGDSRAIQPLRDLLGKEEEHLIGDALKKLEE